MAVHNIPGGGFTKVRKSPSSPGISREERANRYRSAEESVKNPYKKSEGSAGTAARYYNSKSPTSHSDVPEDFFPKGVVIGNNNETPNYEIKGQIVDDTSKKNDAKTSKKLDYTIRGQIGYDTPSAATKKITYGPSAPADGFIWTGGRLIRNQSRR